jgi:hypothetical protein
MSRHGTLAGTRRLGPAGVHGTLRDLGSYPEVKEGVSRKRLFPYSILTYIVHKVYNKVYEDKHRAG